MKLRPYQEEAIGQLRRAIHDRPILVLPTGAGKTVVMSEIVRLARGRVLFLCHRRELVAQAIERFAANGVYAAPILAGEIPDPNARVQVASIPTLIRRELPPADLVIVDECHHATSPSWQSLLEAYSSSFLIGCTATPFRLDGSPLSSVFGRIVVGTTTRQLCDDGYLVQPRIFSHPIPDVTARVRAGDYALDDLADFMADSKLVGDIIGHWKKHGPGRTVAFAVNVAHSKLITQAFLDAGVPAEHLDGKTPKDARAAILDRLESGETTVVSNCMVLGEGFDCPALDVAVLARPTMSLALYLQQIGRIMRSHPGKSSAVVLDHAGLAHRHGCPLQELAYSLEGKVQKDPESSPVKLCKECFAQIPVNATSCPECFSDVPEPEPRAEVKVDNPGELVEFKSRESKEALYASLVREADQKRFKLGWARVQYKDRTGVWPRGMKDLERAYRCYKHVPETRTFGHRAVERCAYCLVELSHAH